MTYSDLMTASGVLDRAARYLLAQYGSQHVEAMGILLGLAFSVRPQLVKWA